MQTDHESMPALINSKPPLKPSNLFLLRKDMSGSTKQNAKSEAPEATNNNSSPATPELSVDADHTFGVGNIVAIAAVNAAIAAVNAERK